MTRRLKTKPALSPQRTADFFNDFAVAKAVARVASSVLLPLMISRRGRTATGLKKWKPTTRSGCSRPDAISVMESEEVLVARMVSGAMNCSSSAKTFFLTSMFSKTASMTKSVLANAALSREPETSALRRFAASGGQAPLALELVDFGVDVADTLVDAFLVDVGQDDRHLELADEEQRELAGHEAGADDADAADLTSERAVGCSGGTLGALVHQIEGVQTRAEFVRQEEVGKSLVLGREALVERGGIGDVGAASQFEQLDGLDGAGSVALGLAVDDRLRTSDRVVPALATIDLGASGGHCAGEDLRRPGEGLLDEVGGIENDVDDAEFECLLGGEHLVLVQRVLDHHGDGVGRADEVGEQLRSAPTGDQTEECFRKAQRARVGGNRAVVAVQAYFEAAAQGDAVDEGERGNGGLTEASEHLVAQAAQLESLLTRGDRGNTLEVRAGGEDEGLAGDGDGNRVGGKGFVEGGVECCESAWAEGRRLGVVEAVVEGDQCKRALDAGGPR